MSGTMHWLILEKNKEKKKDCVNASFVNTNDSFVVDQWFVLDNCFFIFTHIYVATPFNKTVNIKQPELVKFLNTSCMHNAGNLAFTL